MKEGFVLNPYDPCISNKMINGSQCTIAWHVDDNKVSHVDQEVIDNIMKLLETHFGEFEVIRGDEHKYLGMNLKFRADNKFEIDMIDEIRNLIENFSEDVKYKVTSSSWKDLFEVKDGKGFTLAEEKKEEFHSTVAKLIFY